MPITAERLGEFLRESLAFLAQHDSLTVHQVTDHLEAELQPTVTETQPIDAYERPNWKLRFLWSSTGMAKAGWLVKDGAGNWSVTPEGRDALEKYPDAEDFRLAVNKAYREWKKSTRRRAWLVRGSSVQGMDLVPTWLQHGYCSLPASHLRPVQAGIGRKELEEFAREDYAHLNQQQRNVKVEEIVAFMIRLNVGDVVVTTSANGAFVGDVKEDWEYSESEGGRSNVRRSVDWRNADAPFEVSAMPEPLTARLQTNKDVAELTSDLKLIDEMLEIGDEDETDEAPVHVRLATPSASLAGDLFVDPEWLDETADLLNERRQVILYGPPGTGKTYIAQKLAADLVGPEQVKLVQFHPAYTYEDFFEGYRPAPGATEGTINFELRAGPLRQLVERAREHPEQAFVLIIDEINRGNLAKIFGELYFLLEYRDQAVDLLYSADEEGFTLPKNFYLIGTMNTADRTIALIDAAMRRRFAFVELSPDTEPTKSLLAKWSAAHGLGTTASDLLQRLNARIEDPDFRIGPAYFMKSTDAEAHSSQRLQRIWRTSIRPLLQEHHYGEWESVKNRYKLDSLLAVTQEPVESASPVSAEPADDPTATHPLPTPEP